MAKAAELVGLDCNARASTCGALVLRTRLEEMCSFRAAALDWADAKGVHDMRVASRRLRSAARDFAPYLAEHLPRRRLHKLARALGTVRNEDVAVGAFEKLASEAPPEIASGLRLHIATRIERREQARNALAKLLTEPALAKLRDKFLGTLARIDARAAASGTKRADEHARTFITVGREILSARLAEFRSLGT